MEDRELPVGWTSIQLNDAGSWGSGGTPSRTNSRYYENGTIPWLVIGDLNDDEVKEFSSSITEEGLANSSAKLIPSGSLLVAMYGSIGKLGITTFPCTTNQAIAFCIPNDELVSVRYLFHSLANAKPDLIAKGQGGAQQNISQGILKTHPIPLAPLNEQHRIADKLDTTRAAVESCRQRLDDVAAILKRFRQAVLAAATTGELTREWRDENPDCIDASGLARYLKINHQNAGGHRAGNAAPPTEGVHDLSKHDFPHEWQLVCLRDIVKPERPITYGILKPGPELKHGIPYVRVADYPGNRLSLDGIRKTSPEIDELYKRSRLEQGDLLLSIRGTVGRLISTPAELIGANITQDSARLSIQEVVDSFYVKTALQSEILQSRMRRAIKGVAVRGINIGDVRALQIPLPSIEEQEEISRRVKELLCLAEQLEVKLSAARKAADQLTPALLAKAFQGDLVPQDPNDQSATELLAKLKAQQSNAAAASPPKRSKTQRKPPSMTNSDKDAIKAAILSLKSDHFSFDELRAQAGGDYESLKTGLFELLEDPNPVVRQVFDDQVKAIILERVKE